MEQHKFCCSVEDGQRHGIVTVWADAAELERLGDDAIIIHAKRKWRELAGPSIEKSLNRVQVLVLEEIEVPAQQSN